MKSVDKLYTFIIGTEVEVFSLMKSNYMRKNLTVDSSLMLMTLNVEQFSQIGIQLHLANQDLTTTISWLQTHEFTNQ